MKRYSVIHLHGHIHKTKIEKKQTQELHVWARRWNPDSGKWTVYDDDGNNRFPMPRN
ncbi:MAG: hypothetical protein NT166_09675 [Candidatus Aminicenantes bacterium]|nr:hypothetical protein [Candidatus Aminicenantes bacterium]